MPDMVMTRDGINLFEKGESVKTELETAEFLNKFFSNIVNNLEISKYSNANLLQIILKIKLVKISAINKLKFTENKVMVKNSKIILCSLLVRIFFNNKTLLDIEVNSNICHPMQYGISQSIKILSLLQSLSYVI